MREYSIIHRYVSVHVLNDSIIMVSILSYLALFACYYVTEWHDNHLALLIGCMFKHSFLSLLRRPESNSKMTFYSNTSIILCTVTLRVSNLVAKATTVFR